LEAGYWRAYKDFYLWKNILRSSRAHTQFSDQLRHLAYSGGWKKFEPMWDWVIRAKRVTQLLPVLESVLAGFGKYLEMASAPFTEKSNAPSTPHHEVASDLLVD
jgi:hypothetical protein